MTKKAVSDQPPEKVKVIHPYVVLGVALVLPGVGQIINNTPVRGMAMVLFMVLLGWVTYYTTTPEQSFLGRYAGGFFIYAISVMDAYRWARHRWHHFKKP